MSYAKEMFNDVILPTDGHYKGVSYVGDQCPYLAGEVADEMTRRRKVFNQ